MAVSFSFQHKPRVSPYSQTLPRPGPTLSPTQSGFLSESPTLAVRCFHPLPPPSVLPTRRPTASSEQERGTAPRTPSSPSLTLPLGGIFDDAPFVYTHSSFSPLTPLSWLLPHVPAGPSWSPWEPAAPWMQVQLRTSPLTSPRSTSCRASPP